MLEKPAQEQRLLCLHADSGRTPRAAAPLLLRRERLAAYRDAPGIDVDGRRAALHDFRVCNWHGGHSQSHSLDTGFRVAQTYIGAARARKPCQGYPVKRGKREKVKRIQMREVKTEIARVPRNQFSLEMGKTNR